MAVKLINELIDSGNFAGQSDVISQAFSEFFTRYHDRKEERATEQPTDATRKAVLE